MLRLIARTSILLLLAGPAVGFGTLRHLSVDESIFVKGLKPGEHETILYVWTRDGDGKESDFLAVVDVDPESESYGEIVFTAPTNSPANEAHHFGYTVNADRIFGGGMFSNKLFIYDVRTNPRAPRLIRTVDLDPTGYSGPHTLYAVPGGVMLAMLGSVDGGGPAALVKVDDDGNFVEAYPAAGHSEAPRFMYDVGVKLELNRMITSSWAHPQHLRTAGGVPPEHVGDEIAVWDWTEKRILQVEHLDPAPLEVRWMHGPEGLGGFVNSAGAGTIWYWEDADGDGTLEFHRVIETGESSAPADMRISYDNRFLYVSLWGAGRVQQYDVSNPLTPELVAEVELPQANMMKLSPDSERLYVTNSILSTMDGEVEFRAWLLHVGPSGMELDDRFRPDFQGFATGPAGPHDMLLK
ncbi:MAG: selenium-binding protein SBP56-related protein [Gemmatimonadota bacterium]